MIRILHYLKQDNCKNIALILSLSEQCKLIGSIQPNELDRQLHLQQPDVVMIDVDAPGAMPLMSQLRSRNPSVKVLVLTENDDIRAVNACLKQGVHGYIVQHHSKALVHLPDYLKDVVDGGFVLTPKLVAALIQNFFANSPVSQDNVILTTRQAEILKLLVNGESYKGISSALNIALDTVRSHIKDIYQKLCVNSKSQAVVKAIRENLV